MFYKDYIIKLKKINRITKIQGEVFVGFIEKFIEDIRIFLNTEISREARSLIVGVLLIIGLILMIKVVKMLNDSKTRKMKKFWTTFFCVLFILASAFVATA
ncbi:MAG: hypothetical protein PHH71_00340 [Clostridia bacterium]|jgi:membrane protein insertase Oxa1/YidC/SpoIIIJ|nr:hypothetical protein [Clostridia bacterium]MDD3232093.1 hypothetical protein [Clostridia bacterium]MDD3862673.1 hypothetical protein [Clostridia bacterium]MDD4408755.1 hypothetical protein [Clostridia bacterium]